MIPRSFDVMIVGGGPAGSTCAWQLQRAGLRVVVVDRHRFPRDKICAGWITPQVTEALELNLTAYAAAGNTIQPVRGFAVGRDGAGNTRITYQRIVSYGIRRCEFDEFLLTRSNAALHLGEPVRRVARDGDEWVVNDALRAPVLVGAGGHFCPIAQHLGVRLGQGEPIVAAQEIEFRLSDADEESLAVDAEIPEITFADDLKGYGWVFRKGHFLNVGLGRQDTDRLAQHVAAFVAALGRAKKIPALLPRKLKGHPYLLYDTAPRPLGARGVLLIGDAAGLAYPRSGEGIRPAVESGLFAAAAILDAGLASDAAARRVRRYTEHIHARFGARGSTASPIDFLPDGVSRWLAGRLFRTPWFARRVILDDWFFHRRQPALRPSSAAATVRGHVHDAKQSHGFLAP